jgi:polyribonucleotide nucleotidyltransferase
MGLITDEVGNYAFLTDIEGIEDAYGDMDFKVAGTAQGITALQLDIKLKGISTEIIRAALEQARPARLFILETMQQTISTSRSEVSKYAPRMYKMSIEPSKIGAVIGTGGKTIRGIIEETKTTIDIDNEGTVVIGSSDEAAARRAIEIIESLTKDVELGAIYTGKVVRITSFGAFVEILPGKDGMVHISELADYRVARVEDEVNLGDEITVKVIDIDDAGKVRLSRRAVFAGDDSKASGKQEEPLDPNYPFRSQRSSGPSRNRPGNRPRRGDRR